MFGNLIDIDGHGTYLDPESVEVIQPSGPGFDDVDDKFIAAGYQTRIMVRPAFVVPSKAPAHEIADRVQIERDKRREGLTARKAELP